jgi:heme oxygenase
MSAIAALRAATWSSHQRLEKRRSVKARFSDAIAYRAHLESMWGFCAPLDQLLTGEMVSEALSDCALRRTLPSLTGDLLALGARGESVACLPRCADLPMCADPAAALGCL